MRRARPPCVRGEADRRHASTPRRRIRDACAGGRRAADGRPRRSGGWAPPAAPPRWCARGPARRGWCWPRRRSRCPASSARRRGARTASATPAARSCSSASTTSTRSPPGSARCAETTGMLAHVHTDADIDDVGVATMRVRVGRARRADRLLRLAAHLRGAPAGQRAACSTTAPTLGGRVAGRRARRRGLDGHGRGRAGRPSSARDMLAEELRRAGRWRSRGDGGGRDRRRRRASRRCG